MLFTYKTDQSPSDQGLTASITTLQMIQCLKQHENLVHEVVDINNIKSAGELVSFFTTKHWCESAKITLLELAQVIELYNKNIIAMSEQTPVLKKFVISMDEYKSHFWNEFRAPVQNHFIIKTIPGMLIWSTHSNQSDLIKDDQADYGVHEVNDQLIWSIIKRYRVTLGGIALIAHQRKLNFDNYNHLAYSNFLDFSPFSAKRKKVDEFFEDYSRTSEQDLLEMEYEVINRLRLDADLEKTRQALFDQYNTGFLPRDIFKKILARYYHFIYRNKNNEKYLVPFLVFDIVSFLGGAGVGVVTVCEIFSDIIFAYKPRDKVNFFATLVDQIEKNKWVGKQSAERSAPLMFNEDTSRIISLAKTISNETMAAGRLDTMTKEQEAAVLDFFEKSLISKKYERLLKKQKALYAKAKVNDEIILIRNKIKNLNSKYSTALATESDSRGQALALFDSKLSFKKIYSKNKGNLLLKRMGLAFFISGVTSKLFYDHFTIEKNKTVEAFSRMSDDDTDLILMLKLLGNPNTQKQTLAILNQHPEALLAQKEKLIQYLVDASKLQFLSETAALVI